MAPARYAHLPDPPTFASIAPAAIRPARSTTARHTPPIRATAIRVAGRAKRASLGGEGGMGGRVAQLRHLTASSSGTTTCLVREGALCGPWADLCNDVCTDTGSPPPPHTQQHA